MRIKKFKESYTFWTEDYSNFISDISNSRIEDYIIHLHDDWDFEFKFKIEKLDPNSVIKYRYQLILLFIPKLQYLNNDHLSNRIQFLSSIYQSVDRICKGEGLEIFDWKIDINSLDAPHLFRLFSVHKPNL